MNFQNTLIITSRSRYQLANFVIGQHDTAPMRYRQILIEAQDLSCKIRMAELDIQKKKIEIERLRASGDPIDAIEAEEKQIGITLTEQALKGAIVELAWLQEMATETGEFTFEQIEADQPAYWTARLNRQGELERLSAQSGITSANLQSMLMAGLLKKEEPCAISSGD